MWTSTVGQEARDWETQKPTLLMCDPLVPLVAFVVGAMMAMWYSRVVSCYGGDNTAYIATISRLCTDLRDAYSHTNELYAKLNAANTKVGPGNPEKPEKKDV
jgi:hypothetical protein